MPVNLIRERRLVLGAVGLLLLSLLGAGVAQASVSGNTAPTGTLQGAATGLDGTAGIDVTNSNASSVRVYNGLQPGFAAADLPFPETQVGNQQLMQTPVTNTGGADLVVTGITIDGPDAGQFSLTAPAPNLPMTITPGNAEYVGVTFAPESVGAKSAYLEFVDNAADSPQKVALTGTGTAAPTPTPTPTPAPKKTQKPADSKGRPPAQIKSSGITVITGADARTNAGQRIRTRVRCTHGPAAAGEQRYCTAIRGANGKVSVRTYGQSNVRVIVVQSATATAEYKAYRKRTVYVDGEKR